MDRYIAVAMAGSLVAEAIDNETSDQSIVLVVDTEYHSSGSVASRVIARCFDASSAVAIAAALNGA